MANSEAKQAKKKKNASAEIKNIVGRGKIYTKPPREKRLAKKTLARRQQKNRLFLLTQSN